MDITRDRPGVAPFFDLCAGTWSGTSLAFITCWPAALTVSRLSGSLRRALHGRTASACSSPERQTPYPGRSSCANDQPARRNSPFVNLPVLWPFYAHWREIFETLIMQYDAHGNIHRKMRRNFHSSFS
jgi:hypothetical protein